MQTFLPYPDFRASLEALDKKRLGKQRVEAWQIWKWLIKQDPPNWRFRNHPAVLMWSGFENALLEYYNVSLSVFAERGGNNIKLNYIPRDSDIILPLWFGDKEFHSSHRRALLFKNMAYYAEKFPKDYPEYNYVWPVTKEQYRMTPKEFRQKWVEALRSGIYKQGQDFLKKDDKYCCLGVVCELYNKYFPDKLEITIGKKLGQTIFQSQSSWLPIRVKKALGLRHTSGSYIDQNNEPRSLGSDNDYFKASFSEIADIIESEPEGLFE